LGAGLATTVRLKLHESRHMRATLKTLAPRNRPRSDRRVPRKPPVRTQTTQLNIRMTDRQRERLEADAAKLVTGICGARVHLGPWLLGLGLADADKILGAKK
jgi:hypothetical protein